MQTFYIPASFQPQTILCPVSLRNDVPSESVQFAYSLAQRYNARLTLLHVFPAEVSPAQFGWDAPPEQSLLELRSGLRDVPTKAAMAWGDPASAIIRETARCDLVVMRASQPSWLVGRVVDSLSQRVCRLAQCPVMLVHQGGSHREDVVSTRASHRLGQPQIAGTPAGFLNRAG